MVKLGQYILWQEDCGPHMNNASNLRHLYRGFISYPTVGGSLAWFFKTGTFDREDPWTKVQRKIAESTLNALKEVADKRATNEILTIFKKYYKI